MFRKKQKLRRLTQKLIDKGLDPKSEAGSRFLHFLSERDYDNHLTTAFTNIQYIVEVEIKNKHRFYKFKSKERQFSFFDYEFENKLKL